jgi:hypothetical protein
MSSKREFNYILKIMLRNNKNLNLNKRRLLNKLIQTEKDLMVFDIFPEDELCIKPSFSFRGKTS